MKRFLSLFLIIILTLSLAPSTHADAAKLKLNKAKVTMEVASTFKLTLGKISGSKVSWSSSKKSVATVSKWGTITAKSKGKSTITAKYNNKKYTCTVTVKAKDYSGWVQYSTDNIDNLMDGILNGYIVYIDGKYYCSPEYFEMISNAEIIFDNNISDAINQHNLDPDLEIIYEDDTEKTNTEDEKALEERISAMTKYGFASSEALETEIGKAYIEFCNSWVSEYELKNVYNISTYWSWWDNKIYLIPSFEDNYILENAPDKFTSGEIYSDSGIKYQYLEKFEYNGESFTENQFFFNREDLIAKGIIK